MNPLFLVMLCCLSLCAHALITPGVCAKASPGSKKMVEGKEVDVASTACTAVFFGGSSLVCAIFAYFLSSAGAAD